MKPHRIIIAIVGRLIAPPFVLCFHTLATGISAIPSIIAGTIVMISNVVTLEEDKYRRHDLKDGWHCFRLPFVILPFGLYRWLVHGRLLSGDFYDPLTDIINL